MYQLPQQNQKIFLHLQITALAHETDTKNHINAVALKIADNHHINYFFDH